MKIAVFNGSPRGERGNTHAITAEFARGAEEAGAEVEIVFLADKSIRHCLGCFTCWTRTPGKCVIDDDMGELIPKMASADVAVFATPLYVDNVTGIMKNFMDRLIPLADPHFERDASGECRHVIPEGPPRKFMVISNCGYPEQSHFQVLRLLFRRMARNAGAELVGEIYRGGGELFSAKSWIVSAILLRYRKLLRQAGRELVEHGKILDETSAQLEQPLVSRTQYIRGANKHWDREIKRLRKE